MSSNVNKFIVAGDFNINLFIHSTIQANYFDLLHVNQPSCVSNKYLPLFITLYIVFRVYMTVIYLKLLVLVTIIFRYKIVYYYIVDFDVTDVDP